MSYDSGQLIKILRNSLNEKLRYRNNNQRPKAYTVEKHCHNHPGFFPLIRLPNFAELQTRLKYGHASERIYQYQVRKISLD